VDVIVKIKARGVIVPLITPFDEKGELDLPAVRPLVDFQIDRGISGLFPGGTTGEGVLLTDGERRQLAEAVIDAAQGRVPVIIHAGAITTQATVDLARHAQQAGADAVAIIAPYYYTYDQEALYQHYARVARQMPDLAIYLYHNPLVGHSRLSLETIVRIVDEFPNVVGIKDSSNDFHILSECAKLRNGDFNATSGNDALVLASMAMGFDGCVSGNSNAIPEVVVGITTAVAAGDLDRARALQRQLDAVRHLLGNGNDLSLFKGILGRRGIPAGTVRGPMVQASQSKVEACWRAIQDLHLDLIPVT
jgi:4-hydroxy-tetrahydrodipicolinate synthase